MTRPDDARWLRAQLDRELGDVTGHPGELADVLRRGRREAAAGGRWQRLRPPVWALAATAVLAVALAVPLVSGAVPRPPAREPLAASGPASGPVPARGGTPAPPVLHASPSAEPPARTCPAPAAGASTRAGAAPAGVPVDVDGDGRPDLVRVTGGRLSAVLPGRGAASGPLVEPGPALSVLPVETDGAPGAELLVLSRGPVGGDGSVGLHGVLYALRGCTLAAVPNAQGAPYTFEVGSWRGDTVRAGVACAGGVLLGVTSSRTGSVWSVTRTPVSSAGGTARNGVPTTTTVPDGTPGPLQTVSCGDAQPRSVG